MKRSSMLLAVVFLCLAGAAAGAADASPGPPKVLQVFREQVKPGKGAAHEKVEAGWPAAFAKAGSTAHYLAMVSITGPSEAWFITPWDSFAAAEKEQQAMDANAALKAELERLSQLDGDLVAGFTGMLARYRPEFSYNGDFDAAKMRYFIVTTIRMQPGHDGDLVAAMKILVDAHTKAKVDEHWVTYEVVSGAPGGTYLLLTPMRSLAEMDAEEANHGKAFEEALGEEGGKKVQALVAASTKSFDTVTFAFNPKMSYVSKGFAARDADFWTPKPPAAVPPKKEAPKK